MKFTLSLAFFTLVVYSISLAGTEQPSNLKTEVTSATQVKLIWSGNIDDYCYQLRVKEKSGAEWNEYIVMAPSTNRRISNLKAGTSYTWEVQCCGKSKRDISGFIKGADFTTFSDCHAPEEISMVRSGLDYLILNWDDIGASKYEVKIQEIGASNSSVYFTQNNTMRIDNLSSYTEYEISISSYCKETDLTGSVFSQPEIFSTYSFLQNDFERLEFSENNIDKVNVVKVPKMIGTAKLINSYGQVVSDIKPAMLNSNGVYFDLNSNTPSGIYVVQIAGSTCKRYLLR